MSVVEGKKLCIKRCLTSIALSMLLQLLLLSIFLLHVNFHILHPIDWLTLTVGLLLSVRTWLSIVPLLCSVLLYNILLGKSLLAVRKYYASRFRWLFGTGLRKFSFFSVHALVGFFTAWFYMQFVHDDYRYFHVECFNDGSGSGASDCLNTRYMFLMYASITTSCYHFAVHNLRRDPQVAFPLINQTKLVQIRTALYAQLRQSLWQSLVPTLCYASAYWLLGAWLNTRLSSVLGDADCHSEAKSVYSLMAIATDWRLLLYTWILTAQLLCNMALMQQFFSISLTTPYDFIIERNPMQLDGAEAELTIVEALAMEQVPIVQHLAALQLYNIAQQQKELQLPNNNCNIAAAAMRQEIFSLSVPGGHPNNWNQLCGQSMCLIDAYIDMLTKSMETISNVKSTTAATAATPLYATMKASSASEAAERILLQQYNARYGIRRLVQDTSNNNSSNLLATSQVENQNQLQMKTSSCATNAVQRINAQFERYAQQIEQMLRAAYRTIPGFCYIFAEAEGAQTAFLLAHSQTIIWVAQGIAGICVASLVEDRYGVVQAMLPQIIKTLLRLKRELDKLHNVNSNGKRALDRHLIALRNAVKRSLYQICSVFGDYLKDLTDDHQDYRSLLPFVNYQEA